VSAKIGWPIALAGFSLSALWCLVQCLPITPTTWHHPLWSDATEALGHVTTGTITLNPELTETALIQLCTAIGVFWLALQHGKDKNKAHNILLTLAITCAIYATYGVLEYISGTKTILWFSKFAYVNDLTSTFVNKNNYATYTGLGWLTTIALLYRSYGIALTGVPIGPGRGHYIVQYLEKTGWKYGFILLVELAALLYSHSRAGFLATLFGVLVFAASIVINRHTDRKFARKFALASISMVIVFFAVTGHVIDDRLGAIDLSVEERPRIYQLTLTAIGNQPLLGVGFGAFQDAIRFYRTSDIHHVFYFAHNTYLETVLDQGAPAALLLVISVLAIVIVSTKGAIVRRRDNAYPALGVGASFLVGSHALLDFSLQIPAVALAYACLLGIAFSQSWSSRSGTERGLRTPSQP
jgi:O-antigen ligase